MDCLVFEDQPTWFRAPNFLARFFCMRIVTIGCAVKFPNPDHIMPTGEVRRVKPTYVFVVSYMDDETGEAKGTWVEGFDAALSAAHELKGRYGGEVKGKYAKAYYRRYG